MSKRIVFPQPGRVALQPFEPPPLGASDVEAVSLYSLMSIGTETTILDQRYDRDSHFARMFSFPQLKTGVQTVARVVAAGEDVQGFAPGDHVYVRTGHGSHHVLAASLCSAIPDHVDLKAASWCGLAKTAFRAAWAGEFEHADSVLIIGAGPVGQMCLRWAAALGVAVIVVCDPAAQRLEHARRGGAHHVLPKSVDNCLEEINGLHDGQGAPLVVDSTGNPDAFSGALAAAGRFGRIVLLGDTGYPGRQRLSSDVMMKGLTITATHDSHDRDGWTQARIDRRFFDQVLAGRFRLDGLITHEFSPAECSAAYDLARHGRDEVMGVLFDWTQADW